MTQKNQPKLNPSTISFFVLQTMDSKPGQELKGCFPGNNGGLVLIALKSMAFEVVSELQIH